MIDFVLGQDRRDLGGFEVGRVLPQARARHVGPFVFFDEMGPVDFPAGIAQSVDVRPHPHIGLSTLTYLFAGEIMHRDSVGSAQAIRPGEVNWMTAGSGVTHSERFERARLRGELMHGLQTWIALPDGQEEIEPAFAHYAAAELPVVRDHGVWIRVAAGAAFGVRAPVATHSPLVYAHAELEPGATVELPGGYAERAVYVARGEVETEGRRFTAGAMVVFKPGAAEGVRAMTPRDAHAARRRSGRAATPRLELRLLLARAHRAGEGRLARRAHEAARSRPRRVHPLAARPDARTQCDVLIASATDRLRRRAVTVRSRPHRLRFCKGIA